MTAKRLLIVAHVPSENTRRLRDAVVAGASLAEIEGVAVTALSPFDAGPAEVQEADALILGTTENLGYMSGALKDFFDRIYYPCLEQTQGLSYALYIRAGHDGTGTRRAVESITTGLRWRAVQEPLICRGEFQEVFVGQCEELGTLMAAGLEAGICSSAARAAQSIGPSGSIRAVTAGIGDFSPEAQLNNTAGESRSIRPRSTARRQARAQAAPSGQRCRPSLRAISARATCTASSSTARAKPSDPAMAARISRSPKGLGTRTPWIVVSTGCQASATWSAPAS